MTGASGAAYGVRLLERLRELEVESHLIVTRWARVTLEHETEYSYSDLKSLADFTYGEGDQAAPVSSGSFLTRGMAIVPCSTKTLAAIATGFGHNLVCRAADVMLKERRRLVLAVRETPLSQIHLRNMLTLSEAGATIMPPVPAFYHRPDRDLGHRRPDRAADPRPVRLRARGRLALGRLPRARPRRPRLSRA